MSAYQPRTCTHMFQTSSPQMASINGVMPTAVALASSAAVALRSKSPAPANTQQTVAALSKTSEIASTKKDPKAIIRLNTLLALVGMSRSTVYNRISPNSKYYDPMFPKPVRLGAKAVGWILADVYAYIEHLRHGASA